MVDNYDKRINQFILNMASKPKVVQKEKAPKKNPYKQELSETKKNEIKKRSQVWLMFEKKLSRVVGP